MNIFHHYSIPSFSNCYTLGEDNVTTNSNPHSKMGQTSIIKEAIIIDPGSIDSGLINFIESDHYQLLAVLLTHSHANHTNGIRTLKRIYDFEIYAANQMVQDCKANFVKDGDIFDVGSFHIQVISTPGHSIDSVVYKIGNILFTGDALSAGKMGRTDSSYGAVRQISMVQNKVFTLHGNLMVFPGHGPPTSLEIERKFNIETGMFQKNRNKSRRTAYNLELID
ncbi:MAG: hypothetical protein Ta2B_19920 [Termitinemataceae bacterium]|nr:MAG: hypothetical protein Ta2B_19920 [Termitinemataceae bacterium]